MRDQKGSRPAAPVPETAVGPAAGSVLDASLAAAEASRARPGRRSVDERQRAVLEVLSGKATVDQVARRLGVLSETVEGWRQDALGGIEESLRRGSWHWRRRTCAAEALRDWEPPQISNFLARALRRHLRRQPCSGSVLAEARRTEPGYLNAREFFWVLHVRHEGRVAAAW